MSENEKITIKIKKLIDKANGTDSLQEAETFMLAAQRLLQQYNLDMSKVMSTTTEDRKVREDVTNWEDDWQWKLMSVIARNNFCTTIINTRAKTCKVVGTPNNIEVAEYLFSFFSNRLTQLSIKAYDESIKEKKRIIESLGGKMSKKNKTEFERLDKAFILDYLAGGVVGIETKMDDQKYEAMRTSSELKGLMVVNDDAVAKYVQANYPNLGYLRERNVQRTGAYGRGVADGKNISVNAGVGSTNKGMIS